MALWPVVHQLQFTSVIISIKRIKEKLVVVVFLCVFWVN
jgi:hypothetical protein